MRRAWLIAVVAAFVACSFSSCSPDRHDDIVVGSKNFSEQALLGEILAQHIEARTHKPVTRRFYLAGTYICQQALLAGRIDMYVEYTGTALTAVLRDPLQSNSSAVFARVQSEYKKRFDLDVLPSLGFNNTFAIVVRGEDARRLNLKTISDAAPHAHDWRAGFGFEFMERPDGYPGLSRVYGLTFAEPPRILDLGLLYRALLEKQVDIVAGNSTDGLIDALHLVALTDDRHYFPPYDAVPVVRRDTLSAFPQLRPALTDLANKISAEDMRHLNAEVDANQRDVPAVVRAFRTTKGL